MKTEPTGEELAVIAAALLRFSAAEAPAATLPETSRWHRTARREGVTAALPATWRG
jgi:hypothetical protein